MKTTLQLLTALLFFISVHAQEPAITGDLMLCPNANGTAFITTGGNYDSYTWYWRYWFLSDPFTEIPGANGPSFTYDWQTYDQAQLKLVVTLNGNTYESNVIQIDSYAWVGLTTGFETVSNVSINPENGNVMLCEGTGFTLEVFQPFTIVQWFRDGTPITGATGMQLNITQPGVYHVEASPGFCPDNVSSSAGTPTVVELDTDCQLRNDQYEKAGSSVAPNPVTDVLSVNAPMPIERIAVYSLSAQLLKLENPATAKANIDLSGLAAGMYLIEVQSGETKSVMRIVKQ